MRRKIFSTLFALVLVLSFSLVTAVPAMATATYTVDDDWQTGDAPYEEDTDGDTDFATIQAAIDAASSGDTINVAAGTYECEFQDGGYSNSGALIIGKPLHLQGSGDDCIIHGKTEALSPAYYFDNSPIILVKADNVEITGFKIEASMMGYIGIGGSWKDGSDYAANNLNVHDNTFVGFSYAAVIVDRGNAQNLIIANNNMSGAAGINLWHLSGGSIINNIGIATVGVGIFLMGCDGTTVSGNEVTVFGRGLRINSPEGISGDYAAGYALFGPLSWTDITGDVVYAEPADGCDTITNDVTGKIALIDRGSCTFSVKVKNAQDAGAIGVIIANNEDELLNMAGYDASITIPTISVKQSDGDAIKAELATGVNATLSSTPYVPVIADEGIHIQSCNNITVTGNTISDFTAGEAKYYSFGKKGAGIWISGGCDALTIENNNLRNNTVGVYAGATAATSSSTNVKINNNNIEGNADYGVLNIKYPESGSWSYWDYGLFSAADATIDATNNWWGAFNGPSGEGPGDGDAVSLNVNFANWLLQAPTWVKMTGQGLAATPPTVDTSTASDVAFTLATLNGNLTSVGSSEGGPNVSFVWGTSSGSYPNETTPTQQGSTGTFSASLTTLTAGQTYYFKAKAKGSDVAAPVFGDELSFTTAAITTLDATDIGAYTATLNGHLEIHDADSVDVSFEWGLTTEYGSVAPVTPITMTLSGDFSAGLTTLDVDVLYHFRAQGDIGGDKGYGLDNSFTTAPVIGISVSPTSIDFGDIIAGHSSGVKEVTVTNEGDYEEIFTASLEDEDPADFYTANLAIDDGTVALWEIGIEVPSPGSVTPGLVLSIPIGADVGPKTATLIFWAEAASY